MDEYEKLEKDLVRHYEGYLERFRNLDFLENELDMYHKVRGGSTTILIE
jgi:clusterin-associated protein 1